MGSGVGAGVLQAELCRHQGCTVGTELGGLSGPPGGQERAGLGSGECGWPADGGPSGKTS